MKKFARQSALIALFLSAPVGAFAQSATSETPPPSSLPSAVAARVGGAIKPAPGARPVEGIVIPPLNPADSNQKATQGRRP